jgi:hypothetical protein
MRKEINMKQKKQQTMEGIWMYKYLGAIKSTGTKQFPDKNVQYYSLRPIM